MSDRQKLIRAAINLALLLALTVIAGLYLARG